jgi:sulfur-oxidizing protein SoxX
MKTKLIWAFVSASLMVGTALAQDKFQALHAASFKANGIATLDRLNQDDTQQYCSNADALAGKADPKKRAMIEKENLATVRLPSDGNYFGDWKEGEKIAQSGRGATWTDKADTVVGGGCYNCHQISKKEISYGSIGPSLYNYGKMRGVGKDVVEYTWGKIYNSKAYNACSNMPRFGHYKLLNEQQMRHLMSLLLDPQSPVNQ